MENSNFEFSLISTTGPEVMLIIFCLSRKIGLLWMPCIGGLDVQANKLKGDQKNCPGEE